MSIFDENSDLRISMNPKWKTMKKIIPRHIKIKFLNTSNKENILKAAIDERHILCTEKQKDKDNIIFLVENNASKKIVEQHLRESEKNCQPRILYPENIPFKKSGINF